MQITYADRCALLEGFRKLAKEWAGDDAALIAATTSWAAELWLKFGFECSLGREIFFLGDTLRKAGPTGEVAELARGGLAFLQQNNRIDPLQLGPLGLLDDAFVAGYAAHLVREKLGEPARYSPPQLSPEEKVKAEGLFVELLDRSADEDDCLPAKAKAALGQLGHLLESGLFRRLRVNVQFLAGVLRDSGRSDDHRQIARAALHYVILDNDVIPDHLGLIGFLDDYFVADLAVELVEPNRPPWLRLIDATAGEWPFLNMVVFEDGRGGVPLSEFLLVNTALVCPTLRGSDQKSITHLILPRTGPLPLLLGFLASLGAIWKAWKKRSNQIPFQPGQKVLVDGKGFARSSGVSVMTAECFLVWRSGEKNEARSFDRLSGCLSTSSTSWFRRMVSESQKAASQKMLFKRSHLEPSTTSSSPPSRWPFQQTCHKSSSPPRSKRARRRPRLFPCSARG